MRRKGGKLEVDVIVTWVNGSDLLVRSWREGLAVKVAPVRGRVVSDKTLRHFRLVHFLLPSEGELIELLEQISQRTSLFSSSSTSLLLPLLTPKDPSSNS